MASGRIRFSLATLLLTVLIAAAAVAIGRPWLPGYRDPNKFPWREYTPELVARLQKEDRPMLIALKADWTLTSATMHRFLVESPEVRAAVERHGYVPILVDVTNIGRPGGVTPPIWNDLKSVGVEGLATVVIPGKNKQPVIFVGGFKKERLVAAINGEIAE